MLFTYATLLSYILYLGEVGSGKTTLVAKLQGIEEYMKGRGLEYLYFSVHDDDIDGNQNLLAADPLCLLLQVPQITKPGFFLNHDLVCLCVCVCVHIFVQMTPDVTRGSWTETSTIKVCRESLFQWARLKTLCY